MSLTRSGAMGSSEVVSGNIEFYTLFTTIDITRVRAQPQRRRWAACTWGTQGQAAGTQTSRQWRPVVAVAFWGRERELVVSACRPHVA